MGLAALRTCWRRWRPPNSDGTFLRDVDPARNPRVPRRVSRRYSRMAHEVEDLAHDILLSALRRGSALDGEAFLRSAQGAARRHGAFLARALDAAGRAKGQRGRGRLGRGATLGTSSDGAPLSVLSPRCGRRCFSALGAREGRAPPGARRDRCGAAEAISGAAGACPACASRPPHSRRGPRLPQLRRSQVELLPGSRPRAGDGPARRVLAASDPDGHGLIFAEVLTPGRRTATPDAPAERPDARERNPCSTPKSRTSPSSSS